MPRLSLAVDCIIVFNGFLACAGFLIVAGDSFSKLLSAGCRIGFVSAAPELIDRLSLHMQSTTLHSSGISCLLTDRIATKDDLKALEDRLNARIAYAQVASVVALSAMIVLVAFLGG